MAKRFDLRVDRFQASALLQAVRTKRDVILLWMSTIKSFLAQQPAELGQEAATLSIVVRSMSRLFCESSGGRKIFSLAFPFTVREANDEFLFFSREGIPIDSRVSSEIVSLIENGRVLEAMDFSHFIDPIIEATEVDELMWALLRELMVAEDAYVRYDWDEERADGHRHPIHHLDLYYSSGSSFKVGLAAGINQGTLISILDVDVDCHYLHQPPSA
jgi:hypothetical protein